MHEMNGAGQKNCNYYATKVTHALCTEIWK